MSIEALDCVHGGAELREINVKKKPNRTQNAIKLPRSKNPSNSEGALICPRKSMPNYHSFFTHMCVYTAQYMCDL